LFAGFFSIVPRSRTQDSQSQGWVFEKASEQLPKKEFITSNAGGSGKAMQTNTASALDLSCK